MYMCERVNESKRERERNIFSSHTSMAECKDSSEEGLSMMNA